jgi:hypothetical protein
VIDQAAHGTTGAKTMGHQLCSQIASRNPLAELQQETSNIIALSASPGSGCLFFNRRRLPLGQGTVQVLSGYRAEARLSMFQNPELHSEWSNVRSGGRMLRPL